MWALNKGWVTLPAATGTASTVVGAVALAGWILNLPVLYLLGTVVPIQLEEAIVLLLMGASLALFLRGFLRAAFLLSLISTIISFAALVLAAVDPDSGLGLLRRAVFLGLESQQGMISLNAAIGLFAAAAVLNVFNCRWSQRIDPLIFSIAGLIVIGAGVACVFGYLSDVVSAYGWQIAKSGISLITGVLLILFGVSFITLALDRVINGGLGIRDLWRSITIYSTVGGLTIALLSSLLAVLPFYDELYDAAEKEVMRAAPNRAKLVSQYLHTVHTATEYLSHLVTAINIAPLRGELPAHHVLELRQELKELGGKISGISRFSRSEAELFSTGEKIPVHLRSVEGMDWLSGPYLLEQGWRFLLTRGLANDAYDLMLLKLVALEGILPGAPEEHDGGLSLYLVAHGGSQQTSFFYYNAVAETFDVVQGSEDRGLQDLIEHLRDHNHAALTIRPIEPGSDLTSYARVPGSNLGIVARESRQALYHNVNRKLLAFLAGPVLLAIIGAIGIFLLVRELVGRAEDLEKRQRSSLEEKEVLLKEIHHRVKNNLQVISSLLKLKAKAIDDEEVRKPLSQSQDRVHSIALVHDLLYHSPSLAYIELGEYLEKLVQRLETAYGAPFGTVRVYGGGNVRLDIDTAIPCGLLVTELVTNALLHAFPSGSVGEVRVRMEHRNGSYVLSVEDDGVGISKNSSQESLGLQLVEGLVRQIQGRHHCEGNQGTRHEITFPVPAPRSEPSPAV